MQLYLPEEQQQLWSRVSVLLDRPSPLTWYSRAEGCPLTCRVDAFLGQRGQWLRQGGQTHLFSKCNDRGSDHAELIWFWLYLLAVSLASVPQSRSQKTVDWGGSVRWPNQSITQSLTQSLTKTNTRLTMNETCFYWQAGKSKLARSLDEVELTTIPLKLRRLQDWVSHSFRSGEKVMKSVRRSGQSRGMDSRWRTNSVGVVSWLSPGD